MSARLLIRADARLIPLADKSVHCVVTSPPYWGLRDYQVSGQLGLEKSPEAYVQAMVGVFREVRRILRDDGTCWVNIGDSYSSGGRTTQSSPGGDVGQPGMRNGIAQRPFVFDGLKPKDLVGIPWLLAFALRADGWYLRSEIIWHKPNPMPESVCDRPTKAHEQVFLLAKGERYFYDAEAIRERVAEATANDKRVGSAKERDYSGAAKNFGEGTSASRRCATKAVGNTEGRNKRSVWSIPSHPLKAAHFATMPPRLAATCIKAGCPKGGIVFDAFGGAMTTIVAAEALGRIGIATELSAKYLAIGKRRLERPHARTPRPRREPETAPTLFDLNGAEE